MYCMLFSAICMTYDLFFINKCYFCALLFRFDSYEYVNYILLIGCYCIASGKIDGLGFGIFFY